MAKISKKRKEAFAKFDKSKVYALPEAVQMVKDLTYTKFDASFDIVVKYVLMAFHTVWVTV